ncbi:hypothetical protein GCM10027570_22480 [Streptomonospora sediminis]
MNTPIRPGGPQQHISAGGDAYTAGRDQHIQLTVAPSVRVVSVLLAVLLVVGLALVYATVSLADGSATVITLVGILAVLAFVAAIVIVTVEVWARRRPRRRLGDADLAGLKADLARQARREWGREWHTRMRFPPLTVECTVPSDSVPAMAAAGLPPIGKAADVVAGFAELPPAAQRLVVIGAGGAGKTVLALQLALEMTDSDTDWGGAARVPVYVPAALWDPTSQELRSWLIERITHDYTGFDTVIVDDADNEAKSIAGMLFDRGALLPVLDGLDEMGPQPQAADALIQVGGPFVLTSRAHEFDNVADWLRERQLAFTETLVVRMQPLAADDAVADYISAGAPPRYADGWDLVKERLRNAPGGPLASALTTPLMVALARSVYGTSGRSPEPLLHRADVESYLLDAFFESVYGDHPRSADREQRERRRPCHRGTRPLSWLGFLASRMERSGHTTLAWWELRSFAAPVVLEVAWGAVAGTAAALLVAVLQWRGLGLVVGPWLGLLFGAAFDVAYAGIRRARSPERSVGGFRTRLDLPTIGRWLGNGSLVAATACATGAGLLALAGASGRWAVPGVPAVHPAAAVLGLLLAVVVAATAGMVIGLVAGVMLSRPTVEKRVAPVRAATPASTLRRDRAASLAVLGMFGVALGFSAGAGATVAFGGDFALGAWAAGTALLPGGIAAAMMFTAWTPYIPVRFWLAAGGKVPLRPARFLADAHRWEVLRQFGAHYRFRHAALQRHLRNRYEAGRRF